MNEIYLYLVLQLGARAPVMWAPTQTLMECLAYRSSKVVHSSFTFWVTKPWRWQPLVICRVKLLPDNTQLEDVVVVGYMPRKVTNISASVVKVDAKTIENKPVANPLDALQGKIPGLQIYSSSGEPSATLSMALHG